MKHTPKNAQTQSGMTLVEIMIAMAIGLFMASVLMGVFLNSTRQFLMQNHITLMQESGRTVVDALRREIQVAGFIGCVNESSFGGAPPFVAVQGYDTAAAYQAALGAIPASAAFSNVTGPILVLRHGSYQSLALNANMANTSAVINAGADTFGWAGTTPNMVISDCVGGETFSARGIATAASNTTLTPATVLTRAYGSDAFVRPVETLTFFIATATGHNLPSLYQRTTNGFVNVDLRIADNLEKWLIYYAIGDGATDGLVFNNRLNAAGVGAQWNLVKAIRVDMVLASATQILDAPAQYWFDGVAITPIDRTLRKEMATTVTMRNRIQGN